MAQLWMFEDKFWGTVLLLHHMHPGNLTQAVSLVASTFFYPLSNYLTGLGLFK